MIECSDLSIRYGETIAVDQLNMVIEKGEAVTVVGESGCGKTSLLHAVAGILQPWAGEVQVAGKSVEQMRHGTAIILQQDGLFPWKNIRDNVGIALRHQGVQLKDSYEQVDLILDELGILHLREMYLNEVSGGQRQRVAIARALIQGPDVLLMDEPTGSLDMISKERFQDTLHSLYACHEMTSITVTHDIEEAVYLGMKIVVMKDGHILEVVTNPYYGEDGIREDLRFYELCLKVRQVMKA